MSPIIEKICMAAEDVAYEVSDTVSYLAWRLRDAMAHDQRVEFAVYGVVAMVVLVVFGLLGSMEYADEQAELAYWAERGVTVSRW